MPLINRALDDDGQPIVTVHIGITAWRRQMLLDMGLHAPDILVLNLLVDTGASITALDQAAIAPLNLAPRDLQDMHTLSTGAKPRASWEYDVSLLLPADGGAPLIKDLLAVLEGKFRHLGIDGVLGRDVLARCLLVYDGPAQRFILAF